MAAVVLKRVAPSETIGPLSKRSRKSGGTRRFLKSLVNESVVLLPQPRGSPPVWSDKRQGLCSALPYYKGYQSGGYISGSVLMGSLLDGFPAERDLVDPNGVIIMNIGGGRDVAEGASSNQRERQRDQGRPLMLKGSLEALSKNQYIGIVVGEMSPLMPSKMPHAYNVLDWYFITDIWAEKDVNGFKFWKMKLEIVDPEKEPWWVPADTTVSPSPRPGDYEAPIQECEVCQTTSKQIFSQTWTCLNYSCSACFNLGDVKFADLQYSEKFLKERTTYTGKEPEVAGGQKEFPPSLVPALPTLAEGDAGTEKYLKQGLVCPRCFGCSPRSHWAGWFCDTPGCGFKFESTMRPIAISEIDNPTIRKGFSIRKPKRHEGMIGMSSSFSTGGYDVTVTPLLDLLNGEPNPKRAVGILAHFRPSEETRAALNGADDSFHDLHEHATKDDWMRLPVRHKGGKSEIITSHFAQNYGAQYKYVVSVASKSFSDAPDAVLRALLRMRWAGKQAIDHAERSVKELEGDGKVEVAQSLEFSFVEFNELLALGYFEDDKINWHDDGEDTLGPTVATISLGSPSTMSFRPKLKGKDKKGKNSVFDLHLFHGDIVVMHGTDIHRCYEHRVIPHGKRRFALTSRHISLDKLGTDEDRRLAQELGAIPEKALHPDFLTGPNQPTA